jgi:glycosyltransferase involved in cell wall biosynthesis
MKPRIFIVQHCPNLGGSSISALMLADGLQEAGWETHVAFGADGPIIDRFRSRHQIYVVEHKSWLRTGRYTSFARILAHEIRAAKAFESVLARVRPDIVYVNTSVSLAGAMAAHRLGIPCVWHLREFFADEGGEMVVPYGFKWLVPRVIRRYADRMVVVSKSVAVNMLGGKTDRVDVVPNAVGSEFFEEGSNIAARAQFDLPATGRVIGVPGTLRPVKGHPFFFEAVRRLMEGTPYDLTIAVTGEGSPQYVRKLKTMVQELGMATSVRFLGNVADMASFYRACDIVCVPSVSETFGRTVIEAFATGTPVIASAVGGMRQTISHGRDGLLVPYGDTPALADALAELLNDSALRAELRSNAAYKAKSLYHESIYKASIIRIVAEISGLQPSPVLVKDPVKRPNVTQPLHPAQLG